MSPWSQWSTKTGDPRSSAEGATSPGQAEVAFGVVDQYQDQRLGGALMRELAGVARHAGINELIAEVLGACLLSAGAMGFEAEGRRLSAFFRSWLAIGEAHPVVRAAA